MTHWTQITIRAKGSIDHTKFTYLSNGKTFPPQNFEIAMRWYDAGLLDDESKRIMKAVINGSYSGDLFEVMR